MNNNSSGGKAIRGLDVLILGFAFFAPILALAI